MMKNQFQILSKFNMAKEGYEVLTAFDGREALKSLRLRIGYYYSRFDVARD